MKKFFLVMLTTLLTFTMVGCSNNPAADMPGEQEAETNGPIWAQGKETDGQLFQGLNLDGVGNADDEAYVSVCQYGDYDETATILRIHLGTGETVANVLPAHGRYHFLTGKLFSQDREAIVLEISVPGSNYNAVNLFVLDISPIGSDPIPTSTVRMDTMKGICLNSAADIPAYFDTGIMGSASIVDVGGSSLQGLEIHAIGENKEDLSHIFCWAGGNTRADDGWALLEDIQK